MKAEAPNQPQKDVTVASCLGSPAMISARNVKSFVLVWAALLASSCVSLYQNYNYTVESYGDDLSYVSVYFWGSMWDDDFDERARLTAQAMALTVARDHGASGHVLRVGKPQPFEGGGVYVGIWIGIRTSVSTMSNAELKELSPTGARLSGKGKLERKIEIKKADSVGGQSLEPAPTTT